MDELRKAAILLLTLEKPLAAEVLSQLPREAVEKVTVEIAKLEGVTREQQEQVLMRLERAGVQGEIGPLLNDEEDASYWLDQEGSPKAAIEGDEEPKTVKYDELIQSWQE